MMFTVWAKFALAVLLCIYCIEVFINYIVIIINLLPSVEFFDRSIYYKDNVNFAGYVFYSNSLSANCTLKLHFENFFIIIKA